VTAGKRILVEVLAALAERSGGFSDVANDYAMTLAGVAAVALANGATEGEVREEVGRALQQLEAQLAEFALAARGGFEAKLAAIGARMAPGGRA